MAKKQNDLINQRFGRLVALHIDASQVRTRWVCRCDCGKQVAVDRSNLVGGRTISCGCAKGTHGQSRNGRRSPTMSSWGSMVQRCTNPNAPAFDHYNSRAITICDRWLHGEDGKSGFHCFLEDMGERPSLKHTLERRDNDEGYYPDNCEWATMKAQGRNRTTTYLFLHEGREKTIEELAADTGLTTDSLRWRLLKKKMPLDEALSLPVQKGIRFSRETPLTLVEFEGEMLTLRQVAERTGLSVATIRGRHRHNRPFR